MKSRLQFVLPLAFDFNRLLRKLLNEITAALLRRRIICAAIGASVLVAVYCWSSLQIAAHYRYPVMQGLTTLPAVQHAHSAQIYKDYLVSLNVNTVDDSPTTYSRRLVEILACGGVAVTSYAQSVDALFGDYCHVISNPDEANDLVERLYREGPTGQDLERTRAGADHVLRAHTWARHLEQIVQVVGL